MRAPAAHYLHSHAYGSGKVISVQAPSPYHHDMTALLQVEPNNKDVRALKLRYKKEAAAANAKDKAMYQRAFQKLAQMPDTEPRAPQAEPKMTEADSKPEPESHPIDSEFRSC